MKAGVDIGGTKILAGIIDDGGKVLAKEKIQTESTRGYEHVRDNILQLLKKLMDENGVEQGNVDRIGIACAGQIDKMSKNILFSPNLGWRRVPLRDDIERAFNIPTIVENDVNAATYGEWKFGLSAIPGTVLGVFLGTGVGGGLILDRKLFRGYNYVGAEVGHLILNPSGYRCNCGTRGCFEAYCGGAYIEGRARQRIAEGYRGKIWDIIEGDPDRLHVGHIETASLEGDPFCRAIWTEVVEYLGCALAGLVNLLNPEVILLGGGVISGTRSLIERARGVLEKRAMNASLVGLTLSQQSLGEDAALLGAAFLEENG